MPTEITCFSNALIIQFGGSFGGKLMIAILEETGLNPERVLSFAEDSPDSVVPILRVMIDQAVDLHPGLNQFAWEFAFKVNPLRTKSDLLLSRIKANWMGLIKMQIEGQPDVQINTLGKLTPIKFYEKAKVSTFELST
jgi:hypothetical protein